MTRASKKKSPARKKATPRKKKANAKASPLDAVPDPPEQLSGYGKEYWQRLAPLLVEAKILTPLHLESFQVLCEAWHTYRQRTDELDALDSWTFTTETGYVCELPEVRLRQTAVTTLQKLWPKFGLTPEALAKIGKHGGSAKGRLTPLEEFAASKYGE